MIKVIDELHDKIKNLETVVADLTRVIDRLRSDLGHTFDTSAFVAITPSNQFLYEAQKPSTVDYAHQAIAASLQHQKHDS